MKRSSSLKIAEGEIYRKGEANNRMNKFSFCIAASPTSPLSLSVCDTDILEIKQVIMLPLWKEVDNEFRDFPIVQPTVQ